MERRRSVDLNVSLQNLMTVDCLGMFSTAPPLSSLPHTFASLPAVANHKLAPTFPETKVSFDIREKLMRCFSAHDHVTEIRC